MSLYRHNIIIRLCNKSWRHLILTISNGWSVLCKIYIHGLSVGDSNGARISHLSWTSVAIKRVSRLLYSSSWRNTRNLSAFNCAVLFVSIPRIVHSIYAQYHDRVIDGSRSSTRLQLTKWLRSHRTYIAFRAFFLRDWRLNRGCGIYR